MVAAFPIAKLGFLVIKQISKPIAKRIAASAKNSRIFRDWICIPTAQLFHWYEIQLKLRMLNVGGKATKVPKLNEAKAIEQGSEILSEFLLLSIASSILIYEYNRSSEKEAAKEEARKADQELIKNKVVELELKVERQTIQIKALAKTALDLQVDIHNHSLRRFLEPKPKLPAELEEIDKPIVHVDVVDDKSAKADEVSEETGKTVQVSKELEIKPPISIPQDDKVMPQDEKPLEDERPLKQDEIFSSKDEISSSKDDKSSQQDNKSSPLKDESSPENCESSSQHYDASLQNEAVSKHDEASQQGEAVPGDGKSSLQDNGSSPQEDRASLSEDIPSLKDDRTSSQCNGSSPDSDSKIFAGKEQSSEGVINKALAYYTEGFQEASSEILIEEPGVITKSVKHFLALGKI